MTRRIYIIRHGNTFETSADARRIGAGTDIALVASGRAQAERLGAWFAGRGGSVGLLLSSPLQRSRATAQHIADATKHPIDGIADWLNEIDHGPDEGQPEADVIARIGAAALMDWDRHGIAPPGWRVDTDKRIAAWRAFFAAQADGEAGEGDALLVTSNGAARFALLALGLSAASLKLRTGAFGVIEMDRHGVAQLIEWDVRP